MNNGVSQLALVEPSERVLLLPHCLRRSNTCRAKYNQDGLQCVACTPQCAINRLRAAALEYGYRGICVAPGGHLAVKYITEKRPAALVAVACEKELKEGMEAIQELGDIAIRPLMVIIPLLKNGCLDTEVDIDNALEIIGAGCVQAEDQMERGATACKR
jgi:hypothetical protein